VKKARDFYQLQARNLAKINAAGVRIALGTDSGETVGWTVHQELTDLVAAGMTPAQVITAATKTAAEVVRIDQLGTIAPTKSADFLVLDANPLENINNTRRISKVYLRGKSGSAINGLSQRYSTIAAISCQCPSDPSAAATLSISITAIESC
jgi:imidazolonepropionase-like amidohydrolase